MNQNIRNFAFSRWCHCVEPIPHDWYPGEFLLQGPVMGSFDVFFTDTHSPNKLLNKQPSCGSDTTTLMRRNPTDWLS